MQIRQLRGSHKMPAVITVHYRHVLILCGYYKGDNKEVAPAFKTIKVTEYTAVQQEKIRCCFHSVLRWKAAR